MQLVVHYFGHGVSEFYLGGDYATGDDPFLFLSQYVPTFVTVNGTGLPLAMDAGLSEGHVAALTKLKQLKDQLRDAYANGATADEKAGLHQKLDAAKNEHTKLNALPINRTFGNAYFTQDLVAKLARDFPGAILIVDGCEIAKTFDYKNQSVKIVVGVDWLYAQVVLGAFSDQFASVVSPQSFNDFDNVMPLTGFMRKHKSKFSIVE